MRVHVVLVFVCVRIRTRTRVYFVPLGVCACVCMRSALGAGTQMLVRPVITYLDLSDRRH